MKMTFIGLVLGLAISVAACGSDGDTTTSTPSPDATGGDQNTSTTTAADTTTASIASTTTTVETTTTTDLAAASAVVIDDVETEDGWRYRVNVIPLGTNPESSPGGCVATAPPGQTNLLFAIVIANLITDRSAPNPQFVVSSNLIGDGSAAESPPFAEETIRARTAQNVSEVTPAASGTSCILANGSGEGDQLIELGGELAFNATLGPINEDEISSFTGGIRVFTAIGQAVEAEFGAVPGSGDVIGEFDLISDS